MGFSVRKYLQNAFLVVFILSFLFSTAVLSKSRRPISEMEVKKKKSECYVDVENGLWGQQCRSSAIAIENCVLRCVSPTCYELIYESDPLEEGEKDLTRSQEYKYCMHKLSLGESLEGIKGSFSY
ncbi:hypothetical protein K2173_012213 [Erythroxylum novogranatense]|uniref:Uncharacterized protein n=1 Tax=Erythroxylum novogranatense TaxID=1862640 RepID=A0AAV8T8L1_9ROSI|nr:hypothetical protein K2173_012213 [Erythroxylum novogranatense]